MGNPLSPVLENIFMAKLEADVVRPFNPPFYDRYVDDCFSKKKKDEPDQYLFLGNRARYRFVVLDYHSCSISKRRLIIELDNYKSSSIANRVRLLIELD